MNLRGRMRHVERRAGIGVNVTIPIIWDGRNEDRWRERVDEAHENGWGIKLMRISIQDQADTVEEADDIVARHREKRERIPMTVYRRGSQGEDVLAEWRPELPEWLYVGDGQRERQRHDVQDA